jgi:hypothetical protein
VSPVCPHWARKHPAKEHSDHFQDPLVGATHSLATDHVYFPMDPHSGLTWAALRQGQSYTLTPAHPSQLPGSLCREDAHPWRVSLAIVGLRFHCGQRKNGNKKWKVFTDNRNHLSNAYYLFLSHVDTHTHTHTRILSLLQGINI